MLVCSNHSWFEHLNLIAAAVLHCLFNFTRSRNHSCEIAEFDASPSVCQASHCCGCLVQSIECFKHLDCIILIFLCSLFNLACSNAQVCPVAFAEFLMGLFFSLPFPSFDNKACPSLGCCTF